MSKLVVLSEGFTGRSYDLKSERTTIGRVEDNSFHLAEPSISSHHCEILLKGNDVVVKDLNSTNGTFINGEKVSESVLKPGQILRLGSVEIRLEVEGMAPAATASSSAAPAAAAADKKAKTTVIPRGVKVNEFEQGNTTVKFDKNNPFAKKSNKTNMIFIVVGVILGLAIIGSLIVAFLNMKGGS